LTLVERERIADIKEEIRLGASGAVDKRTAARAGHLLGADAVVVGAITVVGEALRIDARVVATGSGEVLAAAHADGKIETFFEVEATVARELLKALGAVLTPIARMRLGKPATRSLQAALAYGSALDASDRGDAAAARIALAEAVAADPDFAAAKERLAKLERRLDALERRTAEVEVAGGRILKPTSALDHLHNATLADERGERAQALADLRHVLKERPWAVAALTLWAKSTADDSQIAAAARPLAAALRAIAAADVAAAQLTERFTVHEQPTTAEQRAGAWIRLLALDALAHRCAAGAKPHCLAAEERSERAALALWLANTPQDRAVFPRQDDVRAAETHLLAARARGNADVVAHAAVGGPASTFRRATLLARPVAVATPERVGRSMPWLSLQVRVMDAGSRAVNAVLRIGDGAGVRTLRLALVPVIPSPWGEEAGLFAAPLPQAFAQACRPQDKMRVAIDRIDPRGQRRATDLVVPAPRVWGGNWRALGAGVGRNIANTYPMHGVRLAVLGSGARKAASFRILVNAAASVWATVAHVAELDRDDDAAISWSPLWGGVAGPLASGAAQLRHTDDGGHSAGLILPLVVLYADAPIALGSARVVRRFERDGSWHYDTAARAGWMDGGLDGSAAPLDIDVTVAALLAAGRVDLASLALDEAATGSGSPSRRMPPRWLCCSRPRWPENRRLRRRPSDLRRRRPPSQCLASRASWPMRRR
jgi:tetratricopeptide (TPR) repeat protein